MLTDWENPWSSLRKLHDDMNRMLEDRFFGSRFMPAFVRRAAAFPKVNLAETPQEYVLTCELPGVTSKALDVTIAGRELTIKGERPATECTERRYHRHERGFGAFSRIIELPGGVDAKGLSATLKHGVLTVRLTKAAESKPKQVTVKTSE